VRERLERREIDRRAAFTFVPALRADASAGPQGARNETPVSLR
jgi:hypothetical protein